MVFSDGYVYSHLKTLYYYVRCVRGGKTSPSFTNNGNGTVTDNKTGLMWQKGEPGDMTWQNALNYCNGLSLGSQTDWRLPNIKELESITDDTRYYPAIDTTYFPNAYASYYWSSTTYASGTYYAWVVDFGAGGVYGGGKAVLNAYVRCVRGVTGTVCTATLSSDLKLNIPVLSFNGSYYQIGLDYVSTTDGLVWFKLTSAASTQSSCSSPSTLTLSAGTYTLHVPYVTYGSTSYWADFKYVPTTDGQIWFKLTNAGKN